MSLWLEVCNLLVSPHIYSLKIQHNALLSGQCHDASGSDLSLIMLIAVDL